MAIFGAQPISPVTVQRNLNPGPSTLTPFRATLGRSSFYSGGRPISSASKIVQNFVSLGGTVAHAAAPPLEAQHNLLGSLPAPVMRSLGNVTPFMQTLPTSGAEIATVTPTNGTGGWWLAAAVVVLVVAVWLLK